MDSHKLAESWLSDLVALPSVTGEEEAALAWVEAKLIELGYAPQRLPLGADTLAHEAYRPFRAAFRLAKGQSGSEAAGRRRSAAP